VNPRAFRHVALATTGLGFFALFLLTPGMAQSPPGSPRQTPVVAVTPSSSNITTAQSLSVTVEVNGGAGGAIPTGAVVLTSGSYSLPPNLPYSMAALNGIYESGLTTADLTANAGLSNATVTFVDSTGAVQASAKGVAAATPGQAGTASIPFPYPLDATQPTRINVHLCIGSSTTSPDNNQLKIYFSNGANPANGLYFSVGMNSMQLQMWGTPELTNYGSAGIPSGTCGSVFMDWLGTGPGGVDAQGNEQVWAGWIPDSPTDLQAPNNTAIPSTYEPTALGFSAVLDASMLSSTTEIFLSDASANTLVTGVYVSQGRLDGPTDGAMPVPGLFQPVVLDAGNIVPSYQSNEVWIPPTYGDSAGNPIVQTYHPNGALADIRYTRLGLYANLFNAGYILVAVTGDNGYGYSAWGGATYWDSPASASWGGPSGDQYRNAVIGLVRQYLPSGNQYFRMGLSAGAADALNDEMRNPGASGIALYSGVISLTGAWNQAGQTAPGGGTYSSFLPNIQYGWGDWYLSLQGSNTNQTPESSPSYWTKVSSTLAGLPLSNYNAREFTQKGAWNAATTYNQNDIAVRPYAGTISGLVAGDPGLNLPSFAKVPIQAWAEQNDSTIMSPAWQTAFISGVTAAGNKNAISNILTDCPATGGCHLTSGVLNPTNNQPWNTTTSPSPTLAWFNSLRTPWSISTSGSYTSQATMLSNGSATISIAAGSLALGTDTLTATYTPDAASSSAYNSASASAQVTVTLPKITPTVVVTPSSFSVTTAQALTVTVAVSGGNGNPTPSGSVALAGGGYTSTSTTLTDGSATITIPAGSLVTGTDTLTVTYSPDAASSSTYNGSTGSNTVTVTIPVKTTTTITWATPAAIIYGAALSTTQLDASSTVAGSFAYSPAAGTVLGAGSQTLSVILTPTDSTDYTTATASVTLTVNRDAPTITWATPAAINYGAALSTTQLDASSTVAGSFAYSPAAGTVLGAGSQTLLVTFSPTDSTDYTTATASVTLTVNKATPTVTWSTPAAVTVGTALSGTQLNAMASVAGAFVYSPTAGTVMSTAGNTTLSTSFTPTDTADDNSAAATVVLTVNPAPKATPTVTVTPSPAGITTAQALTVAIAVSGGSGSPTPTGSVTLASGTYTAAAVTLNGGSATINVPAGSLATGSNTLTVSYTPDSSSSLAYNSAIGSNSVTVTTAVPPGFAISGASVTVAPGAITGNTSTITLTPAGGFTGGVTLTAAIISSPTGATDLPTLSFGSTNPVTITGANSGTATLTIATTAATSAALANPKRPGVPWYAAGGATLACLLVIGIPARRRNWRTMLGMFLFLAALAGGLLSCSGGGSTSRGGGNPGTTPGNYTVTVTGTSGAATATSTLTLTVQ
jgi:hypothetical protein